MKILIFQHVAHESGGYILEYLLEKKIAFEVLELWKPYAMPDVSGYQALIVLGGPMGVYDDFPSKEDELHAIKRSVERGIPFLGICLGSQLLAHSLCASVYKNFKNGKRAKEIGYYEVNLTAEGKSSPLFKAFPETFKALEWHGDAFDLPKGAELLASSALCDHQAFAYKRAFGVLFHTEFTVDMVRRLAELDRAWTHEDFSLDESRLLDESAAATPVMKKQSYRLLDNFLR